MKKLTIKKLKELIKDQPDDLEVALGTFCHSIKTARPLQIKVNGVSQKYFQLSDEEEEFYD